MIAISASLTSLIRRDFSNLSASWPAVAENRKNGRMNVPAATVTRTCPSRPAAPASRYKIKMTRAFFKKLSFRAPRNWVAKSGRKRRV